MLRLLRNAPTLAVIILAAHLQGLPASAQSVSNDPNIVLAGGKSLGSHSSVKLNSYVAGQKKHVAKQQHVTKRKLHHRSFTRSHGRYKVKRSKYSATRYFWRRHY